jgi:hypothetical protein
MKLIELKNILKENEDKFIIFCLEGNDVPYHFHLTEVGIENKVFIDCGGTIRCDQHCTLQLWVAHDVDHRLRSKKMLSILDLSKKIIENDDVEIKVEYEKEAISQYFIKDYDNLENIKINLISRKSECLAPEKCISTNCCSPLVSLS